MVRADVLDAETLGELEAELFDEAAGVHEDEGGAMRLRKLREAIIDTGPHGGGGE